jgi:hypothetical protein
MQYVDNPGMAVRATAAIPQYALVKYDGSLCGANTTPDIIGVAMESRENGKLIPIRFMSAGTVPAIAAEAIAVGDLVYKAANGKVNKTNTNLLVGRAMEAATADGDFIQIQPL